MKVFSFSISVVIKKENIFSNPVSSAGSRKSVGWPLYSPNNRYILRIDDSPPKELVTRSGRLEDVFVPMIEVDRNEESCAFWNDLVPFLQKSQDEKCRLGSAPTSC